MKDLETVFDSKQSDRRIVSLQTQGVGETLTGTIRQSSTTVVNIQNIHGGPSYMGWTTADVGNVPASCLAYKAWTM